MLKIFFAGDILVERKENILINFMSDSLRKQKKK